MVPRLIANLLTALATGLALLLVAATAATPAAAQAGAPIAIRHCIMRDAPGLTPQALFHAVGQFDCKTPQRAFGTGDFWLISQPLNINVAENRYVFRTASMWQHAMTAYVLFADGTITSIRTSGAQASRYIQLGAQIQRILPHHGAPIVRILWHVEGSANLRGLMSGTTVTTATRAYGANIQMAAIYAGFAGLALAMLIYNLALWRVLRYRFLPCYCLMVAALIGYALSSSGALSIAFPDIANSVRMRINYLTLGSAAAAALAFVRCFFEAPVPHRGHTLATYLASAAILLPALTIAAFGEWNLALFDRLFSAAFLLLIAAIIPILLSAWHRRNDYFGIFALAWGLPIALGLLRCAYNYGWVRYNLWIDNSTLLAMAIESIISCIAITYRIQQLSRDRDLAREQELAARMLADIDPLTGLLNRRAFLTQAIGREGEQVLLVVDIDHFKRVNDTIGHDGGDEVLRAFARTLRQSVPAQALVARFGGEEFAIVMPATITVEPDAVLARLRAARMPFDLTVTASIGLARGPLLREADWKALYRAADAALFDAKDAGRDRARGQIRRAA